MIGLGLLDALVHAKPAGWLSALPLLKDGIAGIWRESLIWTRRKQDGNVRGDDQRRG
jgi:hypothetical protein